MKHKILWFGLLLMGTKQLKAQTQTIFKQNLDSVIVKAYLSEQPLLSTPSSAYVINNQTIDLKGINSFLPILNGVSGVRMEERSPGSYRLSIRGSVLRSPFGVRNVKIYYDDFPLTDAGGNTYLNLIPFSGIKNIEILKGPDGSLFGANSGGVVLLNSMASANETNVTLKTGSYGMFNESVGIQNSKGKIKYLINQDFQRADGYRDHSFMRRHYLQTQERYKYGKSNQIRFSGFYSDLGYQTPGGLNLSQLETNPRSARPATKIFPSAETQGAGIYNKTGFMGLANEMFLTPAIKNFTSVSTILTNLRNPFITNYETRKENSLAIRSYFEIKKSLNNANQIQGNLGWEYQHTETDITNHENNMGIKGKVSAADRIQTQQQFIFGKVALQSGLRFKADAGLSLNFYRYSFQALPQSTSFNNGEKYFKPQLMPRLAMSYLVGNNMALRTTISKGYSPPTTAEVRASDAIINTNLNVETGWNYEVGIRFSDKSKRLYADISAFTYQLNNAIVRRTKGADQDFFVNAGGTRQNGLEGQFKYNFIKRETGFVKSLDAETAITLYDFKFLDYTVGQSVFSGNDLTGVPDANYTTSIIMQLPSKFSVFVQHQYTSKIPLDDGNTVYATPYHLLQVKAEWNYQFSQKTNFALNVGADNVLNQNYSLGNDSNAFGGRFYNAAPLRNYFVGLKMNLK